MASTSNRTVMYEPKDDPGFYRRSVGKGNEFLTRGVLDAWLQNTLSDLPEQDCITICDYGTADGSTSLNLIKSLLRDIRETFGAKKQVHIIYEDQPRNNFQPIFLRVHGLTEGSTDKENYLKEDPNVFVTACGTGFYSQCLPDNTVSIGICTVATHYLSERPCRRHIARLSEGGSDEDGDAAFAKTAAQDLDAFIQMRAKELVSGGWLATSNVLDTDQNKQFAKLFFSVAHSMWTDDLITQDEMEDMYPAMYYRTEEDFLAALQGNDSVARKCGLELVSHTTELKEHPLLTRYKQRKAEDPEAAAQEFGKAMARFIKGTTHNAIMLTLASRGEEAAALADVYFTRLAEKFAASSPDECAVSLPMMHILLRKL